MKTLSELLQESRNTNILQGYFKHFNEDKIIGVLKEAIKDLEQIKKSKEKMLSSNFEDLKSTKDVYLAYSSLYGYELNEYFRQDIFKHLHKIVN